MTINSGFQYMEQRDANDNIVKQGVVSKRTAFCNSQNEGIYDTIAENFRALKDMIDNGLTNEQEQAKSYLETLKSAVDSMYNDMRTNPNFGSTAATAQAQIAIDNANTATTQANLAKQYAEQAKTGGEDLSGYAQKTDIPTKTSQLTNDSGYLTSSDAASFESVKTVNSISPDTNGNISLVSIDMASKDADGNVISTTYAKKTDIPTTVTKTSQLTNDSGYITSTGSVASATKATQDASGNVIATTYLAKADGVTSVTGTGATLTVTKNGVSSTITIDNVATASTATTATNDSKGNVIDSTYAKLSSLSLVATSGSYNDLTDKPTSLTVPTKTSQLTNDSGYITGVAWGDVTGKPTSYVPSSHTQDVSTITGLATVATSGSYSDLTGAPTIPTVPTKTSDLTNDSGYITASASITGNASTATKATQDSLGNVISDTYATKTSIPTKVSSLTNDSGYITSSSSITGNAATATKATQDASGNVIATTYATKANSISGMTISSNVITYTKGDGATGTITVPVGSSSDINVTNTLATTTKAYITGTTSATTNTGTQVFDTGVYLDTTAGMITATTFNGNLSGTASKATSDASGNNISTTYATKSENSLKAPIASPSFTGTATAQNLTVTGTLTASLTGNASTATKATQDASGNVISSTYTKLPVTISATLASGSATNTINNSNITADSLILLGVPTTATKAQIQMLGAAIINCTSQTAGSITLTALGAAPTASIPITITIVG